MNRDAKQRLKTLKNRFKELKKPYRNTYEEVLGLDDIYTKSSLLLIDHEKYNDMKKLNHPNTGRMLDKLLYGYNKILEYIGLYTDDKKIMKLKKSLELNLKDLYKDDTKELNSMDIPSVKELETRLSKLVKFSESLRKKKNLKKRT